jgi:DNA (cytosine-5)-methyltransferase 1
MMMSGDVADRKRLIAVTAANLRNSTIYLSGHLDFFPRNSYANSQHSDASALNLTLFAEGLPNPIHTKIATQPDNGTSRNYFRKQAWISHFFQKHDIREGDLIAIERLSPSEYRLYPFDTKSVREDSAIPNHWPPLDSNRPTAIDLFAGCGGFSLGLKTAGFQNLLAVEWDASCCQTFAANISPRILNCAIQEIETFPSCDLLVGGPPCQGFSNLGERLPNDPRRQLWRHFLRAVQDSKPLIFVMENVPPLLSSAEFSEIFKVATDTLHYNVEARILNSADYGTPQVRKRAFVVGSRIGAPAFPKPTHRNPDTGPALYDAQLPAWKTVRDAIADLPPIPDQQNWHISRNPTELSRRRYRYIPPGGNRWNLPLDLMPDCWKRKTKGGTDLFGRLWWDRPSVTIRTEFYKPEKGRYLHPEENRPITHREAARLQGFPDEFEFKGKRISVGRQIGNAVPPPLAYQFGQILYDLITNHKGAYSHVY